MVKSHEVALFLDALRPPPGMEIDAAVGTTFTLDLAALLAVPVAASFGEQPDRDEPADLLETIRRYVDRTLLFCQAGAISIPQYRAALTFIEQTVVEVAKPPGGIFHPKVWVVRFTGRGRSLHRVLVMSRNLTFDRAWDVIVRLDEEADCAVALDARPIAQFVTDVASAAQRPLLAKQRDMVESLAASVRKARLAVPAPFTAGELVVLRPRQRGRHSPFHGSCDKALAVSPFLTGAAAVGFTGTARHWSGVVSRPGALDRVRDSLGSVDEVLRMKDVVLDAQESVDHVFEADQSGSDISPAMRGLHAKVFLQDVGDVSTAWLGSANLTDAAFSRNWEVMVRLSGARQDIGCGVVLGPKRDQDDLWWLVERHTFRDRPDDAEDAELAELQGRAFELASKDVVLNLSGSESTPWSAQLNISPWTDPDDLEVRARLLSQTDFAVLKNGCASWGGLATHQLTPFVVLELRLAGDTHRALVRAELKGDDYEARRGAVLAQAISSREDFLRYLAALLGLTLDGGSSFGDGSGDAAWFGGAGGDHVLEDLLATASRQPERLASVDQTLSRLSKDDKLGGIVPEEFRELWAAVHAVRKGAMA